MEAFRPAISRRPFDLAPCARVGYRPPVLRRCACFCAVLAVLAAPSVTSTRFFCRYTGQEIFGCAEGARRNAQVRGDDCCDQRTFRAVEGVERSGQDPVPTAASVAVAIETPELAPAQVLESPAARRTAVRSAGPPAFLAHRALLI
jgi:hypothetical protein